MSNIIAAAKITGAEAIHPGYGFLAENADFARACADNDLVFIGPSAECIERMGDKSSARETMKACGVPTVPGSDGCIDTVEEARAFAESSGLSGAHQGHGRRRRQGHARGARPCRPRVALQGRSRRGGARRSATTESTWRSSCCARVTSRCRCSPTTTATTWPCASATARCSVAIRSSSRRLRPRR